MRSQKAYYHNIERHPIVHNGQAHCRPRVHVLKACVILLFNLLERVTRFDGILMDIISRNSIWLKMFCCKLLFVY